MSVLVNGTARELHAGTVVADVVGELTAGRSGGAPPRGVAVAVNGEVVPRAQWSTTALRDGDSVEVLTAVQGG